MSLLGCLAITEGYIVAYLLPLIYRKKVTLSTGCIGAIAKAIVVIVIVIAIFAFAS